MLKSGKSAYEPDTYVSEGTYGMNGDDPADMDAKATAVEMAKRGDPQAAVQFLIFYKSMKTTKAVEIPTLTFYKKGHEDKIISQNAHSIHAALTASGYKIR